MTTLPDPALASALGAALGPLADEVIAAIGMEIPEYRRPLEGAFGQGLRAGVRQALQQFVDLLGHPDGPLAASEVYRELGRGELRAGRSLDALQAAYRLGARISWRRLSEVAREQGADTSAVSALAEAMFAHIERISASSVEGYAQAQAQLAGERERRRRRLVERLVGDEQASEAELRMLAERAGWRVPPLLAALVCEPLQASSPAGGSGGASLAGLIGGEAIAGRIDETTCVIVPDPEGPDRSRQLESALQRVGVYGALGPSVSFLQARRSFRRAREGLALQRRGVLPAQGLVATDDRLLDLIVHGDPELAEELAVRRLGTLQWLPPGARGRLLETLRAWLEHGGNVARVAADLDVHRQTVRYRVGRLRELLEADLDSPDQRLELQLALRARDA